MIKSFYFQHDYNAASDSKILFLRHQLGMEGYGVYWFIIEQLAQAEGILPLRIIPVLAMQTQVPEAKVKAVVEGYELFEIIDDKFFSSRLNKHLSIRKLLSEKGKEGSEKRWLSKGVQNSDPNRGAISDPNAKERKGKEINKIIEWDSIKLNFKNDFRWKEKFCRDKNIPLNELEKKMDVFISDIELREDFKELKELKSHFTNLYNKNHLNSKQYNSGQPEPTFKLKSL